MLVNKIINFWIFLSNIRKLTKLEKELYYKIQVLNIDVRWFLETNLNLVFNDSKIEYKNLFINFFYYKDYFNDTFGFFIKSSDLSLVFSKDKEKVLYFFGEFLFFLDEFENFLIHFKNEDDFFLKVWEIIQASFIFFCIFYGYV